MAFKHCTYEEKRLDSILPITKIDEFANTVDSDETAHNESLHLDIQLLPFQRNAV